MRSYFKFLMRNKLYTLIEVVGLALSLAFVVFVGCYTAQQYSVANATPDSERIYLPSTENYPGLTSGFADVIRDRFPEIEQLSVYYPSYVATGGGTVIKVNDQTLEIQSEVAVDDEFFDMFPNFEFLMGSPDVLKQKDQVIVSEQFARKLFPDGNFEMVDLDKGVRLAAVVADNDHSIFPYADVIFSVKNKYGPAHSGLQPFDNFGSTMTFIKLRKDADVEQLYANLDGVCKEVYTTYGKGFFKKLKLRRLDRIIFEPSDGIFRYSDLKLIYTLGAIALLLLLSSVANFVNLNTALVGQRAHEMATRRLLGSSKGDVMGRYFAESVFLTSVAMVFALLVALWLSPWMNQMIEADVPVVIPFTPLYILGYVLIVVVVGAFAAFLPALLASRFKPIDIVKGSFKRESKQVWTKLFIVVQTAIAVLLISMALVMQAQYRKSLNRDMGCEIKNKFALFYMIPVSNGAFNLEDRIRALPQVKRIGRAMAVPCTRAGGQYSKTATGEEIMYRMYVMDSTSFNMMGFEKLMDFNTPVQKGVWFTESAFRATGFDAKNHDISTTLAQKSGACDHTAGVIGNVPVNIANIGVEEHAIVAVQDFSHYPFYVSVIETTDDHQAFRKSLSELCREYTTRSFGYEVEPMYCDYLEDLKVKALEKSAKQMNLVYVFMALSILISVLGLLAISIYDAKNRAKDIAIRKVFGSSVWEETRNGLMSYFKLTILASLVGLCFAILLAQKYLAQFIVRIERYGWIFLVVILVVLLIAVLTTFWQIWMAARVNPIQTLNKN